jgi:hypothetical protein
VGGTKTSNDLPKKNFIPCQIISANFFQEISHQLYIAVGRTFFGKKFASEKYPKG